MVSHNMRLSNAQEVPPMCGSLSTAASAAVRHTKSFNWPAVCCRAEGWGKKFGLYNFDINDPEKRRTLHETSKVGFCITADMQSFTHAKLRAVSFAQPV